MQDAYTFEFESDEAEGFALDDEIRRAQRGRSGPGRPAARPAPKPGRPREKPAAAGPRPPAGAARSARPGPTGPRPAAGCACPRHNPRFERFVHGALTRLLRTNGAAAADAGDAPADLAADASADAAAGLPPDAAAPATESELRSLDRLELEWEGEVDRGSRDYLMWVQRSLNRIGGLQLAVDGISGPMTRAAVRDFQGRRGLAVDGIVGPVTEASLVAAGAGQPPGGPASTPGRPAWPGRPTPPARPDRPTPPAAPGSGRFPTSPDGTPLYNQADPAWAARILGDDDTIASAGCAMSSMAMAISKIAGREITPLTLDQWLDANGGYTGDAIYWDVAAQIAGLGATKPGWSLAAIDAQLAAGRPVVVGIDYHAGSSGGGGGTDHWIAITARGTQGGRPVYHANDPAGGQRITLTVNGSQLLGPRNYRSAGELVVITG